MADTKISGLTEDTNPQPADLLATVDDPAGTPLSKKATIQNVLKAVDDLAANTAPVAADLLLEIDDPAGTPTPKKSTVAQIVGYVVTTAGDIIYATASRTLARLGIGTAGQVLRTNSGATAPEWASAGGGIRVFQSMPTATLAATIDYRAGGSTPAEQFQVWDFDSSTVEYMDFKCFAESYGGGGFTITLPWSADGTATGAVIWSAAFRRIEDDTDDIDGSHTYVYNDVTDTAPTVDGEVVYPTITFTNGADSDSVAEGDMFILRIRRRADQGGDTMNSNDAELHLPSIKET